MPTEALTKIYGRKAALDWFLRRNLTDFFPLKDG
jgi:hypothetical protein